MGTRRWVALLIVVAGVAAGAFVLVRSLCCGRPTPHGPNVVVIVTDDQRWDTLSAMPNVERLLVDHGVRFTNGFVVNSLCCPSRASILTGEYSHSTGVYTEKPPDGGFQTFDDSSTVATWLHDAGYDTGLFGKYLNEYRGTYIPPGWDEWLAFQQNQHHGYYFDYSVNDQGELRRFGRAPSDYSTEVLTRRAVSFIRSSDRSFFLYFAPYGPHGPATPAPRDLHSHPPLPPYDPPNFDEANVSDKPEWIRGLPRVDRSEIEAFRERQYETLQSVDRAVGELVKVLRETGRLHDTLIAFVSDNGLAWGEHRWIRKEVPYEESIRVPFVVRYDKVIQAPRVDDHFALNLDLAPTIASVTGVEADEPDGRSLVPLLRGEHVSWRREFLIEHEQGTVEPDPPTFCALRTERYLYVRYATHEVELYDLNADPYELRNLAGDPASDSIIRSLTPRLDRLCRPPPPGMGSG